MEYMIHHSDKDYCYKPNLVELQINASHSQEPNKVIELNRGFAKFETLGSHSRVFGNKCSQQAS